MITFTELLTFGIASAGITFIAVYGSIFKSIRPKKGKIGELFNCPLCLGFWVGAFLCGLNHWTDLFNFERTWLNYFICGGIASAFSYSFSMLFGDNGLRIEHTHIEPEAPHRECQECKGPHRQASFEEMPFAYGPPSVVENWQEPTHWEEGHDRDDGGTENE